jgi:diguanylate cyclase (GGDEF)-like protein
MNWYRSARKELPITASAAHISMALLSISALAILIVGTGSLLLSYRSLSEQTDRHLHTLINFAASESRSALEFRDTRMAAEILQSIPKTEGITFAEIRDASGTMLARIHTRTNGWVDKLSGWIGNKHVDQDVVVEGRRMGSITLEGGSGPMLSALGNLFAWFAIGTLLVAACVVAFARVYTWRFTEPILQLRAVVQHLIEDRDFSRHAPPSSLAEVEDLRVEFNILLDEINLRDHLLTQSNAALQRIAYVDALTGLPNRAMFEPELQKILEVCERKRTRAVLFYLDIDAFKSVNDNLGHVAGDKLLSHIAMRLRAWRAAETIATRIGGDEFVVLLAPLDPGTELEHIVHELYSQLEEPLRHGGITVYPSTSIGMAIYPDDARNTEELVRLADQSMYAAKNRHYQQGLIIRWHENEYVDEEPVNFDTIDANPAAT